MSVEERRSEYGSLSDVVERSVLLKSLRRCDVPSGQMLNTISFPEYHNKERLETLRDMISSVLYDDGSDLDHSFEYYAQLVVRLCKSGLAEEVASTLFRQLHDYIEEHGVNDLARKADSMEPQNTPRDLAKSWENLKRTLDKLSRIFVYLEMNYLRPNTELNKDAWATLLPLREKGYLKYPRIETYGLLLYSSAFGPSESGLSVEQMMGRNYLDLVFLGLAYNGSEMFQQNNDVTPESFFEYLSSVKEIDNYQRLELYNRLPDLFEKIGYKMHFQLTDENPLEEYMTKTDAILRSMFMMAGSRSVLRAYRRDIVNAMRRSMFENVFDAIEEQLLPQWFVSEDPQLEIVYKYCMRAEGLLPTRLLDSFTDHVARLMKELFEKYNGDSDYAERHNLPLKLNEMTQRLTSLLESYFVDARPDAYHEPRRNVFDHKLKMTVNDMLESQSELFNDCLLRFFDLYARGLIFKNGKEQESNVLRGLEHFLSLGFLKDSLVRNYTSQLSRRMLMSFGTPTLENEFRILELFKEVATREEWTGVEQMLNEILASKQQFDSFEKWKLHQNIPSVKSSDLTILCLNPESWPRVQSSPMLNLPEEISKELDNYNVFFKGNFDSKSLAWAYSLHNVSINARFGSGNHLKQIVCPSFHAVTLLAFNDHEQLAFDQLLQITGMDPQMLREVINVLTTGRYRLLLRLENGSYSANDGFKEKAKRITIKMTKPTKRQDHSKSTAATTSQIIETDDFLRASIVRFMKARRTATHSELMEGLREHLQERGRTINGIEDVKRAIESLVYQEYITRNGLDSYDYVA